jgi:hypothetical protein
MPAYFFEAAVLRSQMVKSHPQFIARLEWPAHPDSTRYRFWNEYRAPFVFPEIPGLDGRDSLWTGWILEAIEVDVSKRQSVIRFRMSAGAPADQIAVGSLFEIKEDDRRVAASGEVTEVNPAI